MLLNYGIKFDIRNNISANQYKVIFYEIHAVEMAQGISSRMAVFRYYDLDFWSCPFSPW